MKLPRKLKKKYIKKFLHAVESNGGKLPYLYNGPMLPFNTYTKKIEVLKVAYQLQDEIANNPKLLDRFLWGEFLSAIEKRKDLWTIDYLKVAKDTTQVTCILEIVHPHKTK